MTLKTGPDDLVVERGIDPWINIAQDYEVFFTALDTTECPVTSCVISERNSAGTAITSTKVRSGSAIGSVEVNPENLSGNSEFLSIVCLIGTHQFQWNGKTDTAAGFKVSAVDCA